MMESKYQKPTMHASCDGKHTVVIDFVEDATILFLQIFARMMRTCLTGATSAAAIVTWPNPRLTTGCGDADRETDGMNHR
jgi:hypothetical protein